jgi:hypothetical protein
MGLRLREPTIPLTVRVSPALREDVDAQLVKRGLTLTAYMRELIEADLKRDRAA